MILCIYDWDFNPVGMIEEYITCNWTRRFRSRGECTISVPYSREALEILQVDHWMIQQNGNEAMVITTITLSKDQTGADLINVTAYGFFHLLNWRVCDKEYEDVTTTSQKIIYTLFETNITQPKVLRRKLPHIVLNKRKDYKDLSETEFSLGVFERLGDAIEEQLESSELGCLISTDVPNKTHTFDFRKPENHTASSDSPIIFSVDYGTLGEQEFTHSHEQYANVAYITSSDYGKESVWIYDGVSLQVYGDDRSGYSRIEIKVDASDIGGPNDKESVVLVPLENGQWVDVGNPDSLTPDQIKKRLLKRGADELKNSYPEESTFTGKIVETDSLVYKKDWDLGDRVTCTYNRWGITADLTITEITEEYSKTGRTVTVTFGEGTPDFRKTLCAIVRRTM